jgi:hypothetical protein
MHYPTLYGAQIVLSCMDPFVMNFLIGLRVIEQNNSSTRGASDLPSLSGHLNRVIYYPRCKSHLVLFNDHELLNSEYRESALDIAQPNTVTFNE